MDVEHEAAEVAAQATFKAANDQTMLAAAQAAYAVATYRAVLIKEGVPDEAADLLADGFAEAYNVSMFGIPVCHHAQ